MEKDKLSNMRFLGLDLAWAPRQSSGGAVMEQTEDGIELISTTSLRAHEDVLRWISKNRGRDGTVICLNAPLIVENTGGRRPVDKQLEEHFSPYEVKEYTVNTVNASYPRTMARSLTRMGFDSNPQATGDRVIESCTQAAQVLLFGLTRVLRTKSGPIRGRKDAAHRYREQIYGKLPFSKLELQDSDALIDLVEADMGAMNGTRLGEFEEKLDAVMSAYVAGYLYICGPDECAFLGDLATGYILLPNADGE